MSQNKTVPPRFLEWHRPTDNRTLLQKALYRVLVRLHDELEGLAFVLWKWSRTLAPPRGEARTARPRADNPEVQP
jgi:hypothetical protein